MHPSIFIEQIFKVIIVPSSFPALHLDLLYLFLLFAHGLEYLLQLLFIDLLSELAGPG